MKQLPTKKKRKQSPKLKVANSFSQMCEIVAVTVAEHGLELAQLEERRRQLVEPISTGVRRLAVSMLITDCANREEVAQAIASRIGAVLDLCVDDTVAGPVDRPRAARLIADSIGVAIDMAIDEADDERRAMATIRRAPANWFVSGQSPDRPVHRGFNQW